VPLRGVRLGVDRAHRPVTVGNDALAALDRALTAACDLGAEVVEVSLPDAVEITLAASVILLAESHAQHRDQIAAHRADYGADVRDQLDASAAVDTRSLVHALHTRERVTREVERLFEAGIDGFLTPTMAVTAPRIGATIVSAGEASVPVGLAMASFTLLADLTRMPAAAVPTGLAPDGLPTSVQITGPAAHEALVLRVGHALESAIWPAKLRHPRGLDDDD